MDSSNGCGEEGEDKCTSWTPDTLDLGAAAYRLSGKAGFPGPGDFGACRSLQALLLLKEEYASPKGG